MNRPGDMRGLRHVALKVANFEACERFYVELLGMRVEWRPDADNVYLSSGSDNLALHRAAEREAQPASTLDHIGFIIGAAESVDRWYAYLQDQQVPLDNPPKTHRDGARSFYCRDPEGNTVQMLYHPPLALQEEVA